MGILQKVWNIIPVKLYKVEGNSMFPKYKHKDIVIIKKTKTVKEGDSIVFLYDDKFLLKEISHFEGKAAFVIGINLRESTDSKDFGLIELSQIAGKVVAKI